MVNAQAQSRFRSLIDEDAMEYIGKLFHPAQTVLNAEVTKSTSTYIDVNIKFESLMRCYWEPYRINLRQYQGKSYAYSIIELKKLVSVSPQWIPIDVPESVFKDIARWAGYSESDHDNAIRALYGVSESELSNGQKAAILLMNHLYWIYYL
jgi:hypothetical protein